MTLKPEGNMGFSKFRTFLLLFLTLCFPISLKKPQDLGSQTRQRTKEGNLTSSAAASKAAAILRAQSLY